MGEEVAHLSDTLRIGQRVTKREKGKRWTCEGCQEQVKWAPLAEGGSGWRHLAENGKAIGKEGLCKGEKPRKEIIYETETVTADMIDRSRLQVDSRKWLLARLAAKICSDKLQLASDPDSPLTVKHGLDLSRLSAEELALAEALLRKASAPPAVPDSPSNPDAGRPGAEAAQESTTVDKS
jgi:hypothetical protein